MGVRVVWGEVALARQIRAAGSRWNRQQQVWNMLYAQVVALELVDRIVAPAL